MESVPTYERLAYSVKECAALLGIGKSAAYARVSDGVLPSVRIGGRLLIPRRALEEFLEKQTRGSSNGTPEG